MNLPLNVNEVKILELDVEVKESIRQTKENCNNELSTFKVSILIEKYKTNLFITFSFCF